MKSFGFWEFAVGTCAVESREGVQKRRDQCPRSEGASNSGWPKCSAKRDASQSNVLSLNSYRVFP